MSLDTFVTMYLDWRNNFLTIGAFADHYGITDDDAEFIVNTGRLITHRELNKEV